MNSSRIWGFFLTKVSFIFPEITFMRSSCDQDGMVVQRQVVYFARKITNL